MGARNIFGAFVIAIALFSFWPFVVGRYQQVSAMKKELAVREALVDTRQGALENIDAEFAKFQSQLAGGDDLNKFVAMVPSGVDSATILSSIDAIAAGTGVQLVEVSVSENRSRGKTSTKSVAISLELEGRYESFAAFLAQLESNVRLMDVQTLDLSENAQVPGVIQFQLTANAYFLQ